jgi:uncharacterized repeat protein (TIGR03803 family)
MKFTLTQRKQTASFRMVCLMLAIAPLWLTLAAAPLAHAQTYSLLYSFGSQSGDPTDPRYSGILAQGRDGYMYSTANDNWTDQLGTAFKMSPTGALTVLHHFTGGADGSQPVGGLTLGTDGNFYGTTSSGANGYGTVFKMTPAGAITTLYSFTGKSDSASPAAPPIEGFDGNFYGTALGESSATDYGSVYKMTSSGTFTVLHTFAGSDGANPIAPLMQGTDGAFYGSTFSGGTNGDGTIFRITASGEYQVLVNFNGPNGVNPFGPMVQAGDGNLYNVTSTGGTSGAGVAYKMTPGGLITVLHNLDGNSDGVNSIGGLLLATDGNFYGTNDESGAGTPGWGVLFKMTPTGTFSALHIFDLSASASPQATLLQHTSGVLYGTSAVGGVNNNLEGTFYSFNVGLQPFVTFLPGLGTAGNTIEILGQGFTGTSAVSFNGIPASFTVVSDTYIAAVVPAGATQGTITVKTPGGTLNSNKTFLNQLVTNSADLFLRIEPTPTTVHQGDLITYAFPVWNLGPDGANLEVLNTQVPAGTVFDYIRISGTPGLGTCTRPAYLGTGPVVCHENSVMALNTTWTVRLTVKVTAPAGTVITESAATMASTPDPNMANNSATVSLTVVP